MGLNLLRNGILLNIVKSVNFYCFSFVWSCQFWIKEEDIFMGLSCTHTVTIIFDDEVNPLGCTLSTVNFGSDVSRVLN